MKKCLFCDKEYENSYLICPICGNFLVELSQDFITCNKCFLKNKIENNYCIYCGNTLNKKVNKEIKDVILEYKDKKIYFSSFVKWYSLYRFFTIGRALDVDIKLDSLYVHLYHGIFYINYNKIFIKNIGRKNPVILNSLKLLKDKFYEIKDLDILIFSDVKIKIKIDYNNA